MGTGRFVGPKTIEARIGLSETEAKQRGIPYQLARAAVFRAMTISETRGFMKALIDTKNDCILGFTNCRGTTLLMG